MATKQTPGSLWQRMREIGRAELEQGELVYVPGIDEPLWVHRMTVKQKGELEAAMLEECPDGKLGSNPGPFRAALVRMMVVDSSGQRPFADVADDELLSLPATMLEPLVDVCLRLGGYSAAERDSLKKK